ncbi:MAG: peptidylprolyl isomerase [Bacteroidales bacterium]|nr:peptidylprolyl isomerase [Bacteroidales bacterium]
MKRTIFKTLCLAGAAFMMFSCGNKKAEQAAIEAAKEQARLDSLAQVEYAKKVAEAESLLPKLPAEPVFVIETNLGTMKVKLYSDTPKHRENFAKLALSGYYDGMLFHRVINGFMIQGGDPNSKDPDAESTYGQGGPGYTVPAEILPNHNHKKGALAAARRGDAANPQRESSGSQFYLVQDEAGCASLDGQYTVYGETIEGLEVIDKIAAVETKAKDIPVNPVQIKSIKLDESSKPAL